MPDHLDTFALTLTSDTARSRPPIGAGSADLSALTTAVLSYETGDTATSAEIEWATTDGTVRRAVLSNGLLAPG